jgi:uncharacterized protein (DUF433 family)
MGTPGGQVTSVNLSGNSPALSSIHGGTWLPNSTAGTALAANARHTWAKRSVRIAMAMNYRERIERNPHVVVGEPVLKGTRVTLRTVLASLAEGATTAEILADFPTLREEDVRAAIAFAATSARKSPGS